VVLGRGWLGDAEGMVIFVEESPERGWGLSLEGKVPHKYRASALRQEGARDGLVS